MRAQPLDHVLLGQSVLRFVGQRDRDDDLPLGGKLREDLGLQPAHEAVAPEMPVQPLLAQLALELLGESRAGAELVEPADHPQLRDQLVGVVEHRRARERELERPAGHRRGQGPYRLGALRPRVLDHVRLVDDERPRRDEGKLLAVVGDELVVEDRDVGPRRNGAAAGDDRDRAVRQPVSGLTLPPELHRCGTDDDRRIRVVGLERGERLDGLAEPLFVGEERAARVEHVAHRGPLERRESAAEHRGGRVDRIRLSRPGAADRVGRGVALGEEPGEHLVGGLRHLDVEAGDEAVKFVGKPRVERDGARPLRSRQLLEGGPDIGIPDDLEAELLAVDAAEPHEPRRGRGLA